MITIEGIIGRVTGVTGSAMMASLGADLISEAPIRVGDTVQVAVGDRAVVGTIAEVTSDPASSSSGRLFVVDFARRDRPRRRRAPSV